MSRYDIPNVQSWKAPSAAAKSAAQGRNPKTSYEGPGANCSSLPACGGHHGRQNRFIEEV